MAGKRHVMLALGTALMIGGVAVTKSTSVQSQAMAEVTGPVDQAIVEIEVDGRPSPETTRQVRELVRPKTYLGKAGMWPYAGGVLTMIVGAVLIGLSLPAAQRRACRADQAS